MAHKFLTTEIEHHDDGSATIHHEHEDGKSHVRHAVLDLDQIHDSLEEHLRGLENVEEQLDKAVGEDDEEA